MNCTDKRSHTGPIPGWEPWTTSTFWLACDEEFRCYEVCTGLGVAGSAKKNRKHRTSCSVVLLQEWVPSYSHTYKRRGGRLGKGTGGR